MLLSTVPRLGRLLMASETPAPERRIIGRRHVLNDLRALQARLFSVNVPLERTGNRED